MPPDSSSFIFALPDWGQLTWIEILTILAAIATSLGTILSLWSKWNEWRNKRILERNFGSEFFTPDNIKLSTKYYIPPDYSDDDPTHLDLDIVDFGKLSSGKLYDKIDEFLSGASPYHHLMLLGDSGTGKTSFLLNYYAQNQRQRRNKRRRIALIPLGMPNPLKHIEKIAEPQNTVLFLDGFDEDAGAIQDCRGELKKILEACVLFKRVLITCRTQFFPEDRALERETGLPVLDPGPAGSPKAYNFLVIYLSPFTDEQVKDYLRKRYGFGQRQRRKKAFELVKKIPSLAIRPMLLSHIPEILESQKTFEYPFQLYEEMVEAWLKRERLSTKEKEDLRRFSEHLAVELYVNKEKRGAERIHKDELVPLAKANWNIDLAEWKFRSRSLLNRDMLGNYKFAHRSIMEFLFVKRCLEGDLQTRNISWSDQMQTFLWEKIQWCRETGELLPAYLESADLSRYEVKVPMKLRDKPIKGTMSKTLVEEMLRKHGFFDTDKHRNGKGLIHEYRSYRKKGEQVVIDFKTNLMWQQAGSKEMDYKKAYKYIEDWIHDDFSDGGRRPLPPLGMDYEEAQKYIEQLNRNHFTGFSDWRLPTIEEAMSLMELEKKSEGLYIDPIFDKTQRQIWTSDPYRSSAAWYVDFEEGCCYSIAIDNVTIFVRAVRSG